MRKRPCREPVFSLDKKYGIVQEVGIELVIDWDTHGAAGRWLMLLNSGKYADTLSLDPRLEPGTDFEGSVSELIWLWSVWASSVGGDVNTEPERLLRLFNPGGDAKLDVEYRFVRAKTEDDG